MKTYTAIDLFSGCGGSALGFKKAGFKILAAVDNDKASAKNYKRNNPETIFFEDNIVNISDKDILKKTGVKKGKLTVILACPPCQGFSSARRISQRNDPRNKLIFEFVRLTKEILPEFIAMENVPGLSKGEGVNLFTEAVDMLSKIGYDMPVKNVFDASDFGVPQRRKRLILIGTRLKRIRIESPAPEFGPDGLPKKRTVKEIIGNLESIEAGETDPKDSLHRSRTVSELNFRRLLATPKDGGSWKDWPEELKLNCHKNKSGHYDVYGRMKWDHPAPTLTGGCTNLSKGRFGHPEQNRAISLREAALLQSFPGNYIFEGNIGEISDQIGNSVPPLLAEKIGKIIINSIK